MGISVGGLSSGIDTDSIITQLLELERKPIVQLQKKEAQYQVKLTSYGSLNSALSELKSALEGLDSATDLNQFSITSGDTDLVTASADTTASTGSYRITVQQLALEQKLTSKAEAAFTKTGIVGEGTIHLKVGSGAAVDISVGATDTIENVAKAINDAGAGVRATIISDGTNSYLTLTAETTGKDNVINLTVTEAESGDNTDMIGLSRLVYDEGGTMNLSQTQAPTNSKINVDGVNDIERAGNTISDVIGGVTLTLKKSPAAPDNETTVTVGRNSSAIASKVKAFVDAYNSVIDFLKSSQSYDATTRTAGVLLGDATTNQIRGRLASLMGGAVPGVASGLDRLVGFGITTNESGHLEIDSTKLNAALTNNFNQTIQFFTQDTEGSEGFALRMIDELKGILDSSSGMLANKTKGIQRSISDIQDRVERQEARIAASEERMRAQFNAMEKLLSQYKTTGDYLTQQITGLQNLSLAIANN